MELMRAKEVAKLLNVSTRTVYELAEKWNLPHIRLNGRTIRFELEGIQTFLKRRRRAN